MNIKAPKTKIKFKSTDDSVKPDKQKRPSAKKEATTKKKDSKKKVEKEKPKKLTLDEILTEAINEYNAAYTELNDAGTNLYFIRERSLDVLDNVEALINSIANHPKSFDVELKTLKAERMQFTDAAEHAKNELHAAKVSAMEAGAGAAAGAAVMSLAPSAAMWVATTFGTASTGTAISALSGAAAHSAALAWLGGGALTAGGGGMVAGQALIALAGPIGIGIAGVSLLGSIALFTKNKINTKKEKSSEIESVKKNTESVKELTLKIKTLFDETAMLRENMAGDFIKCLSAYGKQYDDLDESSQDRLTHLVNTANCLAALLNKEL